MPPRRLPLTRPCDRCGVRIQWRSDCPQHSGLCRDCKTVDPLCFRPERHEVAT
jgi:hypothetical protein